MPAAPPAADILLALRRELDETADALRRADLARLLTSETTLQSALALLASHSAAITADPLVRAELHRIQRSVTTCRRLGAVLTSFVELSLSQMRTEPVTHTFRHSA